MKDRGEEREREREREREYSSPAAAARTLSSHEENELEDEEEEDLGSAIFPLKSDQELDQIQQAFFGSGTCSAPIEIRLEPYSNSLGIPWIWDLFRSL